MSDVCFVGGGNSFIEQDRQLLEELGYDVEQHSYTSNFISYCREIKRAVCDADLVFGWFASWETLPAVFYAWRYNVPSIIVIGGYDAACCPQINYGAWQNWKERQAARFVARHADLLLPVSKHTMDDLLQQIKPRSDVRLLYNGVDIEHFSPSHSKKRMAICVGEIKQNNLIRKGLEMYIKVAAMLPDVEFWMVGSQSDDSIRYLKRIASDNVVFPGFVSNERLLELYQMASVVCQFSYYEAFGMAPLEGMACGCIPVVTQECSGMPEFVDDCGYYTWHGCIDDATCKVELALQDNGNMVRDQAEKFSIFRRKKALSHILEGVL